MAYYYTCPYCDSNLDPGETCDCQQGNRMEEKDRKKALEAEAFYASSRYNKKIKLRKSS